MEEEVLEELQVINPERGRVRVYLPLDNLPRLTGNL